MPNVTICEYYSKTFQMKKQNNAQRKKQNNAQTNCLQTFLMLYYKKEAILAPRGLELPVLTVASFFDYLKFDHKKRHLLWKVNIP